MLGSVSGEWQSAGKAACVKEAAPVLSVLHRVCRIAACWGHVAGRFQSWGSPFLVSDVEGQGEAAASLGVASRASCWSLEADVMGLNANLPWPHLSSRGLPVSLTLQGGVVISGPALPRSLSSTGAPLEAWSCPGLSMELSSLEGVLTHAQGPGKRQSLVQLGHSP